MLHLHFNFAPATGKTSMKLEAEIIMFGDQNVAKIGCTVVCNLFLFSFPVYYTWIKLLDHIGYGVVCVCAPLCVYIVYTNYFIMH